MGKTKTQRLFLTALFATVVLAVQMQALYLTTKGVYRAQVQAALVGFVGDLARDLEEADRKSIARRLDALEQTGLFARFAVLNRDKQMQANFPDEVAARYRSGPTPILDREFRPLGFYSFDQNFRVFFRPFLLFGFGNALVTLMLFAFGWRNSKP